MYCTFYIHRQKYQERWGDNGTYWRRSLELHVNTFGRDFQLAALGDLDHHARPVAGLGLDVLDLLHNVVALENLTEDDVTAIEPPG